MDIRHKYAPISNKHHRCHFMYHVRYTESLRSLSGTIAERLAVDLSLPVLTAKVCRAWDSFTHSSACAANALTHCFSGIYNHSILERVCHLLEFSISYINVLCAIIT